MTVSGLLSHTIQPGNPGFRPYSAEVSPTQIQRRVCTHPAFSSAYPVHSPSHLLPPKDQTKTQRLSPHEKCHLKTHLTHSNRCDPIPNDHLALQIFGSLLFARVHCHFAQHDYINGIETR
eukprot:scaffold14412_cov104-Skeletonema_marinoi.AAC.3